MLQYHIDVYRTLTGLYNSNDKLYHNVENAIPLVLIISGKKQFLK